MRSGLAVLIAEGVELVDQTLGMDPAQGMACDLELAGIIAEDDGVGQQAVRLDGAPQRAFGGQPWRIEPVLEVVDAEALEVVRPGLLVGEVLVGMVGQTGDGMLRQGALAHVGQRLGIDHIVGVAGAQQLQEVEAALGACRGEPGEVLVADLGADAVPALMARPGVVDADPGGAGQAGPQHVAGLGQERLLAGDQQAHDLSLGDRDAERAQQFHKARHGDLTLMVLRQHEALQLRPEMARQPWPAAAPSALSRPASASARGESGSTCGRSTRSCTMKSSSTSADRAACRSLPLAP